VNPYSPPRAVIRPPLPGQPASAILILWVPAFLYALHAITLSVIIGWAYWDGISNRSPGALEIMSRPTVALQPLCSFFVVAMLLLRRRIALAGAIALPVVVVAHAQYYGIRLSIGYPALVASMAVWVAALTFFRRLR
jgi:hypothetical protein